MKFKAFIYIFLNLVLNERGSGGGGTHVQKTKLPDPTPEQQEANRMAIELAKRQADFVRQKMGMVERLAPQREELLHSELEAGQQRLELGGKAQEALLGTLTKDEFEAKREALGKEFATKTLARLRGEESEISEQQKERLGGLEAQLKETATRELTGLQGELERQGGLEAQASGLRPSAGQFSESQEELGRQLRQTGRYGEGLRLQTMLGLPAEERQRLESQRQFSTQLGGQQRAGDINAMLAMAGMRGGTSTTPVPSNIAGGGTMQMGGTNLSNIVDQRRKEREALASSTTYGSADRAAGAISGGLTGLTTGAAIATPLAMTGVGLPIAAGIMGISALSGAIFGYNA
ncbi:hypothetical protein KY345_04845 [Candidatus Woesearchaeota archaeon]|nr:hypothetical protein [Candidatus Woesearchaeota archaeon]